MTDWQRVPELEADVKSGKVSLRLKDIPRGKPHIVIDPDEYADDKRIAELEAEVKQVQSRAQLYASILHTFIDIMSSGHPWIAVQDTLAGLRRTATVALRGEEAADGH